nr:hypothetical protein [Endozoicomonas sp.]
FLQGEAGAEYSRQMTLWFERWTDNEIVSHIVLSLDHDYQQVNFRIFFSTDRSMNGGHVPNHSGEWSSHT